MVCFVHVYNCRVVLRNAVHYGRAIGLLLPGRVSIHSSLQLADSTFSLFAHCHHARLVRPSVPFDFICKYRCGSWRETVAVIAQLGMRASSACSYKSRRTVDPYPVWRPGLSPGVNGNVYWDDVIDRRRANDVTRPIELYRLRRSLLHVNHAGHLSYRMRPASALTFT